MLKSLFPWKHNKTKQVMAAQPPMDAELIIQEQNLLPCHVCGRTFLPTPLKKHEKICEKNATKRRKPFDSLKQRVAGTDLADFHQKTYLKRKEEPLMVAERKPRQSKWKEKHLELMTVIRAAKGVSQEVHMTPTPKSRSTASLITSSLSQNERCPSCDRHFGPKAFDRHVEWCKERKARIQQSPANIQQAKERLEARIKYRVPPLNKSKRAIVREKYSSPNSPEPVPRSIVSTNNLTNPLSRGPSIRKPTSLVNVEKSVSEHKRAKNDINKTTGNKKRYSPDNDKTMFLSFVAPSIDTPSPKTESVKSLPNNKRYQIPHKKLNSTQVNSQIHGLTVSSLNNINNDKRMVTWKDTMQGTTNKVNRNNLDIKKSSSKNKKLPTKKAMSTNELINKNCTSKLPMKQVKQPKNSYTQKEPGQIANNRSETEMIKFELEPLQFLDAHLTNLEKSDCSLEESNAGILEQSRNEPEDVKEWFEKNFCLENSENDAENDILECSPRGSPEKSATVVCLFQSGTNLIKDNDSLHSLTDEKSWISFSNFTDFCCLEEKPSSNFTLKRSLSDMNISNKENHTGHLFFRKKFVYESESHDFRKTCQDIRSITSAPALHFKHFREENKIISNKEELQFPLRIENENKVNWPNVESKERLEILRIAAEKFMEETKKEKPNITNLNCVSDVDYCVPKKKRRVYLSDSDHSTSKQLDLTAKPSEKRHSVPNSAASSVISNITPRTVNLIEKILQGKQLKIDHSNLLLALSVSECERLLDIDKKYVEKVEKKLEKCQQKNHIKLPVIVGATAKNQSHRNGYENSVCLPQILCKKAIESLSSNYDPFEVAERQFMELLECDDLKSFTPFSPSPRPHSAVPTPMQTPTSPLPVKKLSKSAEPVAKHIVQRGSVIEPPVNFKDSLDSVVNHNKDTDDFDLIENIINEHFGDDFFGPDHSNGFFLHKQDPLTLENLLDNTERKFSDDMTVSSIDPMLINENDNLSIPEHLNNDASSPSSTADTDITLQNDSTPPKNIEPKATKKTLIKRSLSLVNRKRDINLDLNNPTRKSANIVKNNVNKAQTTVSSVKPQKKETKKGLPILKRSMTLSNPSPKPSFKNKQEVNDFLNGNGNGKTMSTSMTNSVEKTNKSTTISPLEDILKAEDLFAVDDEMYEEYKKYEEMYLKEKELNGNSNKKHRAKNIDLTYGLLTANSEEDDHTNIKLSNDSAYGSLRKTSKHRNKAPKLLTPLESKHVESTSSSGSERGVHSPILSTNTIGTISKVSKFCHECGTKFPVTSAKFCVECGVKRLVL
ncbi:hypothetical protein ABEB36_014671 [Hypothenemus hampei]|uniref:C2HC/C3H-type domain-containing protein n=1 Tax=Hypothenemus hampei TaxID=57062 RepID=A0ABD1E2H7_HYPHA